MKRLEKLLLGAAVLAMAAPAVAQADDQAMQKKIDDLTRKVEKLEDKSLSKWLTIGGDYRFRMDYLKGDVVSHTDAIGTMQNLTKGFLLDPTVAGNGTPSGLEFMLMSQPGKLFSSQQLDTILDSYMPQAMFNFMTGGNLDAVITNYMTAYGSVDAALAGKAMTAQQVGILNTLMSKGVFTTVLTKLGGGDLAAGQAAYQQMIGQMATNLGTTPDKAALLANTALMQSFLGAGSPSLQQVQAYKPKNETLYTNRVGIDLHAKATKDVTVNVRLLAYKTFGSSNDDAVTNNGNTPFFADRVGVFDGTLGHVPSSSLLNVDRAYATWSNIADQPIWFSVGRRPSTNGAPSNLRLNNERPGNGGTPALLVDYAFDGMTLGWAPDIEALPGAYAKVCYGRGFESGFQTPSNSLKDTDMLGVALIPIDTDPLRVWMQWNRGINIFDFPTMENTAFGNTSNSVSLGAIDWYGMGAMSTLKNIGPGKLHLFADGGLSITHPSDNVSKNAGFEGLLTGSFFSQEAPTDKTGWGAYAGARYDYEPSRTKIGFEFNHGSKNWIPFDPAADDLWTTKLGTRGNVYEGYLIQELDLKPISSHLAKAFFKIGYQYYDFEYTGSNNWVGAPVKISQVQSTDLMLLQPLKKAQDVYVTFEVKF
ncbi:MAG TPA: DUF3373 domain-containing protein [Geobacter sp.]|nr:DUF3373 domain-containing protein [Geobacter sp.]